MAQKVMKITQSFITLAQALKEEGIIGTGGQAKWFLQENTVLINGAADDRRGRKLYPGDQFQVLGTTYVIQKQD
ncbi:S4 domain-containing protein YaaA [Agrilactobacillus fermenti]|uniref:S4 domain-containing protein YaaA n=1 Tax=Agrilactobacillus fermenti TaxID=2586909 RepID=UPI001E376E28|nr:S4 domain-containing protein YaaA [Agrilactobacillus fermenti]MCD2257159.1 S4 domain-containing protein YaaA [Agrilactobacillus fermenti]